MDVRIFLLVCLLRLVQSKGLSCKQIRAFVDGHNSRRLGLAKGEVPNQPAASEMKYMIWDSELSAKAADWARTHQLEHNPDKTIGSRRFTTGENMYKETSSNPNWKQVINNTLQAWFGEYKDFTYGPIQLSAGSSVSSKQTGHYTQMVWSESVYLGCGMSKRELRGLHGYYDSDEKEFMVVCNYGPAGNLAGQTPYKAGNKSGELICSTKNCSHPYGKKCQ